MVHVSTCLSYEQYLVNHDESLLLPEEQFENAVYHCHNDSYNAIGALIISRGQFVWNLYRNIHCALCNGAAIPDSNQCTQYSSLFVTDLCLQNSLHFRPGTGTPQITFGLLLDINKDGVTTVTTTEMVMSVTKLNTACRDNEMFDPSIEGCRQIICPPGYAASRGSCVVTSQGLLPPEGIAPNQTHISHPDSVDNEDQRLANPDSGIVPDDDGNEVSTQTPTPVDSDVTSTSYCYLVTLRKGHDNFTIVGNDSVVCDGVTVTVVAFDDSHNPVICSMFTADNNALHTHILPSEDQANCAQLLYSAISLDGFNRYQLTTLSKKASFSVWLRDHKLGFDLSFKQCIFAIYLSLTVFPGHSLFFVAHLLLSCSQLVVHFYCAHQSSFLCELQFADSRPHVPSENYLTVCVLDLWLGTCTYGGSHKE